MIYPLEKSPLYRVFPRNLSRLLGFSSVKEMIDLVESSKENYIFFEKDGRKIQTPHSKLKIALGRLTALLSRIEVPDYLQSGIKGRSYRKNAEIHFENRKKRLITIDIKSFFPSTSYKYTWKCFHKLFRCDRDVASLLTKLTHINGHLPTGASVSTILSFYAYRKMFDRISNACAKKNVKFSCYVDDLTFSGDSADRYLAQEIRAIIRKYRLEPHPRKIKYYPPNIPKLVTGVILANEGMRLPNKRRMQIHTDNELLASELAPEQRKTINTRLKGRLVEAGLLEERFKIQYSKVQKIKKARQ